mmetsp:Transcript_1072/g.2897  ORF Transcript_1072/g.2897 Transcript_1072/m.2897 type:complete len:248 (-) Transcript_1072:1766-2509(-)
MAGVATALVAMVAVVVLTVEVEGTKVEAMTKGSEIMDTEAMAEAAIKEVATAATPIEAMATGVTEIGAPATGAMAVVTVATVAIVAMGTGAMEVVIVAMVAIEATLATEAMGSVRTTEEEEEEEEAAAATSDKVMVIRTGDPEEVKVVATVASDAMSLVTGPGIAPTDPQMPNQTVATSAGKRATGRRTAICASSASELGTTHMSVRRSVVLQADPTDENHISAKNLPLGNAAANRPKARTLHHFTS